MDREEISSFPHLDDHQVYTGQVKNDADTLTAILGTTDFSKYPVY